MSKSSFSEIPKNFREFPYCGMKENRIFASPNNNKNWNSYEIQSASFISVAVMQYDGLRTSAVHR
jgi:hypothetical protein